MANARNFKTRDTEVEIQRNTPDSDEIIDKFNGYVDQLKVSLLMISCQRHWQTQKSLLTCVQTTALTAVLRMHCRPSGMRLTRSLQLLQLGSRPSSSFGHSLALWTALTSCRLWVDFWSWWACLSRAGSPTVTSPLHPTGILPGSRPYHWVLFQR